MGEGQRNKTVLGPDCKISGELALDNDAVIMGQFKGTLRVSGVLELTESSQVSGTIIAGSVRMAGAAEADVVAEQGVELLPGAHLTGQLYTTNINVSEGATFQGDVCVGPKAIAAASEALSADDAEERRSPMMSMPASRDDDDADHEPRTMPGSVNQILQRRRAKVLSARQTVSNGHEG